MNIPLNGRIAIVDDKPKEIQPLMNIFSKRRIPFNYYSGLRTEELPSDCNENPITLLFLDLNIIETQHNPKTVISTLHPILKSICPENFKPYCIIIWSKKINDFADSFDKHFKSDSDLKYRRPIKTIRLSKSDYFSYNDGDYIFQEDKYPQLQEVLHQELEKISLMKNLLSWENIVHKNSSETISEFASLYPLNEEWDKNMKAVIFHLAKAVIGSDDIKATTDNLKLIAAFNNINSFLAEKIKNNITLNNLGIATDIKDEVFEKNNKKDSLNAKVKADINAKLHLAMKDVSSNSFEQGNIYIIGNNNLLIKRILWKEKYNNVESLNIRKSRPTLVQLDITPVCDYFQDKQYIRIIHGLMLSSKYYSVIPKSDYQIRTPIFVLNEKEKFFLFDFRFLVSLTREDISKREIAPKMQLKKEICTDIQSQLSNQINRPGISYL